ncbi:MAG: RidA family protein [Steroidobacteraceae bacterium]
MFVVVDTGLPKSPAPVSGTVRTDHEVFTAQIPKHPVSGKIVPGGIEVQARQALGNLRQSIEAAGGTLADVVQVLVFLIDAADAPGMNKVYTEFFREPYPNRATVVVKELLQPGMRIEMLVQARLAGAREGGRGA